MYEESLALLDKHWEACSKDYPEGYIDQLIEELIQHPLGHDLDSISLIQQRKSLFALLPFLMRLYS